MTRGYLAVDGGGSSTEFFLVNDNGQELLHFFVGSTSIKSVGAETACANIFAGVRQLFAFLEEADEAPAEVWGVWGLSGCDSAADQAEYEAMLTAAGLDLVYHRVVNDSLLALRAVTAGSGIVLISGTGSICVGVDNSGQTVRLGGWGYQMSDLGSGAWIGSQLLREALLFDDGCREDDPAFSLVYQQVGCERGELGPAVARMTHADQWASFARIALECEQSPLCDKIAGQAAEYLVGYASAVASRMFKDQPFMVVLAGGLFKSKTFAQRVLNLLDAPAQVLCVSPVLGGIAMQSMRLSAVFGHFLTRAPPK